MSRWGWWAILVANLAGPGRSAVAVAAGASGWPFTAFLAAQAVAASAWSALYCGLGFFAAGEAGRAEHVVGRIGLLAGLLLVVALTLPTLFAAALRVLARGLRPAVVPVRPAVVRPAVVPVVAGATAVVATAVVPVTSTQSLHAEQAPAPLPPAAR
jgi:hypothetical protein